MCHYAGMASDRVRELKAILDRAAGQAEPDKDYHPDEDESLRAEAIGAFVAGGVRLLEEATPALWEYYRAAIAEFTPEQRREYGLPEIPGSADIWEHVSFPHEESTWHLGDDLAERGRSYLSFEGEVSWEPEHGLQLVFEDGQRVCKAGPYDGHLT
jgi:hypothetical protein